jgi:mRNA interferase HigB
MELLNQQVLQRCVLRHASSKKAVNKFAEKLMGCASKTHAELLNEFPTADYVGNDRYVFNIKGNHFRVICVVVFMFGIAHIRFAGTHAEYDKIDAAVI